VINKRYVIVQKEIPVRKPQYGLDVLTALIAFVIIAY
jgi:hypothetical protein